MTITRKEALLNTGSWIILEHRCSAGLITSLEQKPTCPWIQRQRNEATIVCTWKWLPILYSDAG